MAIMHLLKLKSAANALNEESKAALALADQFREAAKPPAQRKIEHAERLESAIRRYQAATEKVGQCLARVVDSARDRAGVIE